MVMIYHPVKHEDGYWHFCAESDEDKRAFQVLCDRNACRHASPEEASICPIAQQRIPGYLKDDPRARFHEENTRPKDGYDEDSVFTYHSPKPGQPETYQLIREKAKELALLLRDNVPPGRELALARTKLEETVFWANAGIARNG